MIGILVATFKVLVDADGSEGTGGGRVGTLVDKTGVSVGTTTG